MPQIREALGRLVMGQKVHESYHLGNAVFASVDTPHRGVEIRKHYKTRDGKEVAGEQGFFINYGDEWYRFATAMSEVERCTPELGEIQLCTDIHQNQMSYFECIDCCPFPNKL